MKKKYPVTTLLALYDPDAIGIRTIATFIKVHEEVDVNQIFFKNLFTSQFPYTQKEIDILIGLIKDLGTEILGISVRSSSYKVALEIIKKVRAELDNVAIIIGGTHAVISPEECIEAADMVCIGEGEYPFLNIVRSYNEGKDKIKDIQGLWVKYNEEIYKNDINELISLDEIPVIDYSDNNKWFIEEDMLKKGDPITKSSVGEVFSSRGCPYSCTYCTNNILKGIMHKGKFVRLKNVDNVIRDIENIKKYFKNLKKIVFADEVFAVNKKWVSEFCDKYKKEVNLPFAALFHPNVITEDIIKKLKEAGLTHARMGVQSGVEEIRGKLYKRSETDKKIVEITNLLHKYNIRVTFDIIVNNPYETEEDLKKSLEFYLTIPRPFEMNLHSLVYFPKTELTNMALKDHIIKIEHIEGEADEALRLNHVLLKDKKMIYGYKNNLFWNCIFSLTSKSFIPIFIIRFFSKSVLLKKKPVHLLRLSKAVNLVNIVIIGLGLLKRREVGIKDALYVLKDVVFASSVSK